MDDDGRLSIIVIILLFIASAYLALTETALASVQRNKIKTMAEKGDNRAVKVLYVLDHFDDAITTLLICTNIAHIEAASLATVLVTRKWGLSAVTLSTFIFTLAMFFIGELLPKSIGKKASVKMSLACSGLLIVLMKICSPFSHFLTWFGNAFSKLFKSEDEISVTEDELYDIIEDMAEEGSIDDQQEELISSALQFADVTAASVLTPRVDISAINVKDDPEAILAYVKNTNHSRILVYEKTIDNVIGVLQIRKFLKKYIESRAIPDVRSMVDPVPFFHSSTPVDEILDEMTTKKFNIAVITDSFGGTLGIVTVEDILEEIVGEIWDEDDVIRDPIVKIANNVYIVYGDETVLDTFEFIGFKDPEEAQNEERFTNLLMAAWVYEQFTQIPKAGDSFDYYNLRVTVSEITHNRIVSIRVEVREPKKEVKE